VAAFQANVKAVKQHRKTKCSGRL